VTQPRQRLSDDHDAVSKVLNELLTALDHKDLETSYARLDLLWARLAVHIRAEHLHLFPAVTSGFSKSRDDVRPDASEALATIENLRIDHDFFMRGLARGIGILRELRQRKFTASDEGELADVGRTVREVERRLATHNEVEETQVYRWSSIILTESEQSELLARVTAELENRPPRFSKEDWEN